jgi:hypothetical protein
MGTTIFGYILDGDRHGQQLHEFSKAMDI